MFNILSIAHQAGMPSRSVIPAVNSRRRRSVPWCGQPGRGRLLPAWPLRRAGPGRTVLHPCSRQGRRKMAWLSLTPRFVPPPLPPGTTDPHLRLADIPGNWGWKGNGGADNGGVADIASRLVLVCENWCEQTSTSGTRVWLPCHCNGWAEYRDKAFHSANSKWLGALVNIYSASLLLGGFVAQRTVLKLKLIMTIMNTTPLTGLSPPFFAQMGIETPG